MPTVEVEHKLSPEHQAQLDKLKVIVKNNWKPFFVGAGIAGITCLIMKGRYAVLLKGADRTASNPETVFVRPFFLFSNNNKIITVVQRMGSGRPGNLIHCLDTDRNFSSQNMAAKFYGITDKNMSLHVRGKLPEVNGLHFERIPAKGK